MFPTSSGKLGRPTSETDSLADDPTSVLRVLGEYQSKVRRESMTTTAGVGMTRPRSSLASGGGGGGNNAQQRLRFDDSSVFRDSPLVSGGGGLSKQPQQQTKRLLSSGSRSMSSLKRPLTAVSPPAAGGGRFSTATARKVARVDAAAVVGGNGNRVDPLEGLEYALESPLADKKRTRYPSAEELTALKAELERTKMKLVQKEADWMDAQANAKKSEALVKKMQLEVRKEAIENEERIAKVKAEARKDKDRLMYLEDTMESRQQRLEEKKSADTHQMERLRESNASLELKCRQLTETNQQLKRDFNDLEMEVNEFRVEEREEVLKLRQALGDANMHLESSLNENQVREGATRHTHELGRQLAEARTEVDALKIERDELRQEVEQNNDIALERAAIKDKLEKFPGLVRENKRVNEVNKLLMETADNNALLKTKVEDLEAKLKVTEDKAAQGQLAEQHLLQVRGQLRKWQNVCRKVMISEELEAIGGEYNISHHVLAQKVAQLQQAALDAKMEAQEQESASSAANESVGELHEQVAQLKRDLASSKNHVEQQASIIKRFKRKLLLVSKERDSFKSVLESYEHELTFTGGQLEKDRLTALEKVVANHKETIEALEAELAKVLGVEVIHAQQFLEHQSSKSHNEAVADLQNRNLELSHDVADLKTRLEKAVREREELEIQLERRAIRGDYDPTDTKVLHFRQNPTDLAREEHAVTMEKLQSENDSLRARVKLLEEGHSKDLTLMVGQKVDENASSQEVQELREQIKSKELQRQRLIEAFQATSQNFREVCCTLTGYRIDGLQAPANQYKLTPVYAESDNDYLLFQREESGECLLLETPFSAQLTDLMELHLGQQNSVPVFLAAVIMDLFSRQTFDTLHSVVEPTPQPLQLPTPHHHHHHQQLPPLLHHHEEQQQQSADPQLPPPLQPVMEQLIEPPQPSTSAAAAAAEEDSRYQQVQVAEFVHDPDPESEEEDESSEDDKEDRLQIEGQDDEEEEMDQGHVEIDQGHVVIGDQPAYEEEGDEEDRGDDEDEGDDDVDEEQEDEEEYSDEEGSDDEESEDEDEVHHRRPLPPPVPSQPRGQRPPVRPPPPPAANDDDDDDIICIDSD